ncbi:MAG: hypothetical protein FWD31_10155, partial [Planctomycetaceae bacterium]|nr:hypothetical protein [Planctomycetaceae bacterium]
MLLIQHRRSPVLRPNNIFRLATVAVLFVLGLSVTLPAQNASDLRLVPFPKQVQLDGEQGFSLTTPLVLHVAAKDKESSQSLGTAVLNELKRAGFPEPELVIANADVPVLT